LVVRKTGSRITLKHHNGCANALHSMPPETEVPPTGSGRAGQSISRRAAHMALIRNRFKHFFHWN
jgi:hypothetical protein